MNIVYNFEVENLESGQRGKYKDSYYRYKVKSDCSEHLVKRFCMNVLRVSYNEEDMTSPFCGRLLKFEKIESNIYIYEVMEAYTG